MISSQNIVEQMTVNKAREINQSLQIYGTFAEIGAGQEVARHFFQAGQASQTIAKTISAYDMIVSDQIYGKESSGRYVCVSRLKKMLNYEMGLLKERLGPSRGNQTCFFSFADTVATQSARSRSPHGWIGIEFQITPNGETNTIVLHVRMRDKYRLQQQEALGILGVNLIHAAFFHRESPQQFTARLVDNLKDGQIVIDMIRFNGKDLTAFDNRLMNLDLVERGLAEAVLFSPNLEVLDISDSIWNQHLMVLQTNLLTSTRPPLSHLEGAKKHLQTRHGDRPIHALLEVTLPRLNEDGIFLKQNFLTYAESLKAMEYPILVSRFSFPFLLKQYLHKNGAKSLAIVLEANHLKSLFDPNHYQDLEGGILEGLGKLLDQNTRLLIYPDKSKQPELTARLYHPPAPLGHLYSYFYELGTIQDVDQTKK